MKNVNLYKSSLSLVDLMSTVTDLRDWLWDSVRVGRGAVNQEISLSMFSIPHLAL